MKTIKRASLFLTILSVCSLLLFSQAQVQTRVEKLEALINDTVSSWKVYRADLPGAESASLDDSGWETQGQGITVQEKTFWLKHAYTIPEVFAGRETENSRITLVCPFRGVGVFKGQIFLDGTLYETFTLEFGNQWTTIDQKFQITDKADPGKEVLIAFKFENLGRLPLLESDTAEPGTYFQVRDARVELERAKDARALLSRLLLDMKVGAILLDLVPEEPLPPEKERPVSEQYKKVASSQEFQRLQKTFKEAVMAFALEAVENGPFDRVQDAVEAFDKTVEPVSRFAKTYTVYVAGNAHIDLAWLWRWQETVDVARATFSTIMDNMEEYPDIVYIQSQAQAYKWMEEYYPEVLERIKQKVKEGRWEVIGGMWAEPDCNLIDGESFIRQILYGKRYFKDHFGVNVKIGWNPDSFGYNWNMPQFFTKSGIDAFVTQKISWNDTNVFPYLLFQWKAPDGSEILSYFPPTGYVGRLEALKIATGMKQFETNTGIRDVFILYGLGDHGGGPNREMLDNLKSYEKQGIFPNIRHSSFSDYLAHIREKDLKDIPQWKDELYLEYHRGTLTTQAETKAFNRKSEVLLANAEKACSLAFLFGYAYPQKDLQNAWERVLMNQFHDILPGSSINPVYKDSKEDYIKAKQLAGSALLKSLKSLASGANTSQGPIGTPLLVFNSLGWERDGVAKTALPVDMDVSLRVLDVLGQEVPSQVCEEEGKKMVLFMAEDLPAMGYRVYKLQKGSGDVPQTRLKADDTFLENEFFRIEVNPETGNIRRVYDKIHKRDVFAPQAQGNQVQLHEDIPDRWDAWNIGYTGRSWMLDKADRVEAAKKGPVMASIKVHKSFLGFAKARREPTTDFPSSFFTQEIILYEGIPRIDIRMEADWWEDHVLLKVAFPVDVKSSKAAYEIPFASVERPTTRNTPWEKARFEVPAIRWADLSGDDYGVSLLNDSKYGHDIEGHIMRLTCLRSPLWPDPMADRGKHRFAYALYPHKGDWREAGTVRRGYEFNTPPLAVLLDPHQGDLPPELSFFKASPQNIILAAVKKAEDRDSLILRLYEAQGQSTEALISLFKTPEEVYELDLMENRLGALAFDGKELKMNFGGSEIKTIEVVYSNKKPR